jgi:transcriptional regulator with XRE-family HTH domain
MPDRAELRSFLRARRARIRPEDTGITPHGTRRVPGLRRDELSQLAGLSVEYYTQLEQGREIRPSDAVLDALARALRLGAEEREHLYRLARPRAVHEPAAREEVRPAVRELVDSLDAHPAFVLGPRMDVLAWNSLASALIVDFRSVPVARRNIVRLLFLEPSIAVRFTDWDAVAADAVAHLRVATSTADDAALQALVGELSVKSERFAELWARHDVRAKSFGRKTFNHPTVGRLELDYEALALTEPGHTLVVYRAPCQSSAESLRLLASWTAS